MTVDTAIPILLNYYDNIPSAQVETAHTNRLLQYLQEVQDYVWNYRDWQFTYKKASPAIVIADQVAQAPLPADFLEEGPQGGVYNNLNGKRLNNIFIQNLVASKEMGLQRNNPEVYGIFGGNLVIPINAGSITIDMYYKFLSPTLANPGPFAIPAGYHNTVMIPGAAMKMRDIKGDMRELQESMFKLGLAQMVASERHRKSARQQLPRAVSNW